MDWLLGVALRNLIRAGNLRVITARGSIFTFGDGTGRLAVIRFVTAAAERGVLLDPEIKLGEAYMDGTLVVEQGSIADMLGLVLGQCSQGKPTTGASCACGSFTSPPPKWRFASRR
jgi:cyclopropane-fatty-acyl-phospholipid synthase